MTTEKYFTVQPQSHEWLEAELEQRKRETAPEGYVPYGAYTKAPFETIQGRSWLEREIETHPDMLMVQAFPDNENRRSWYQPHKPGEIDVPVLELESRPVETSSPRRHRDLGATASMIYKISTHHNGVN